jgi:hypothetical protein
LSQLIECFEETPLAEPAKDFVAKLLQCFCALLGLLNLVFLLLLSDPMMVAGRCPTASLIAFRLKAEAARLTRYLKRVWAVFPFTFLALYHHFSSAHKRAQSPRTQRAH